MNAPSTDALTGADLRPIVESVIGDLPAAVAIPTLLRMAAAGMREEHGTGTVNFHHATAEILNRAADSAQDHIPAWERAPQLFEPGGLAYEDRDKLVETITHHYGPQIASAAAFLGITG